MVASESVGCHAAYDAHPLALFQALSLCNSLYLVFSLIIFTKLFYNLVKRVKNNDNWYNNFEFVDALLLLISCRAGGFSSTVFL